MLVQLLIVGAVAIGLAACVAPADLPLPARPTLATTLSALNHDGIDPNSPLSPLRR